MKKMETGNSSSEFDYAERERKVRRKNMLHDAIWFVVLSILAIIFLIVVVFF